MPCRLNHVRHIPTDESFRMSMDALKLAVSKDRSEGFRPFCVVGSAGTVTTGSFDPLQALAGVALAIGWVMFLRATHRSLGTIGLILTSLFFAALIWLLIDRGILDPDSGAAISWIVLVTIAAILAVGMSWSHIRRRLSGQVDVDDVDD
jgi:hypothetical protein